MLDGCSGGATALPFAAASQREFRQEGPAPLVR